jgi:glycerol-3-phosphate acyltransferase PlsX
LSSKTIALDAMGGDKGARIVVPAAIKALKKHPDLSIILVGDERRLKAITKKHLGRFGARLRIHHAAEVVGMDEPPSQALRNKKDSSMRVSINLVKSEEAQACVSAGNTGALMATARFVLKTLPGINRPAIVSAFPTSDKTKVVHFLDLGANVDSSAEHLFQFAVMGSILASVVSNVSSPKVGLLNVGQEEIKGNEQVRKAAELFSSSDSINYYGFVEGNHLFDHTVDVIVCDGFVGNIALKATEGVAKLIRHYMKEVLKHNWFARICAVFAMPIFMAFRKRINPDRYNGASLLGLNGIVIKSHGGTSVLGFLNAIETALLEIDDNIPQKIREKVGSILVTPQNPKAMDSGI